MAPTAPSPHDKRGTLDLRDLLNPAGALTLARLPLAALFPFVADQPALAFGVYALAMLTDVVDGEVARRTGTTSHTGSLLDGFLDKVFHVNAAWALVLADAMPGWWMLCWFSRELLQIWMVPWLWSDYIRGIDRPTRSLPAGKLLAMTLAAAFAATLLRPLVPALDLLATGLTPLIGLGGLVIGGVYLRRASVERRNRGGDGPAS